jgi:TetR/AcrR family transcriptional regulator
MARLVAPPPKADIHHPFAGPVGRMGQQRLARRGNGVFKAAEVGEPARAHFAGPVFILEGIGMRVGVVGHRGSPVGDGRTIAAHSSKKKSDQSLSLWQGRAMNRPYLSADLRRAETVATVIELAASHDPAVMTTGQIASGHGRVAGRAVPPFSGQAGDLDRRARMDLRRTEPPLRRPCRRGPPLARLEAMLAAHVDFVIERPGVPRILFGELQRAGDTPTKAIARQLMAGYRARVAQRTSRCARCRRRSREATDVEAATVLFLAMVQGMVMQGLAIDDFSAMPVLARRLFGLFRRSLGASPCA